MIEKSLEQELQYDTVVQVLYTVTQTGMTAFVM